MKGKKKQGDDERPFLSSHCFLVCYTVVFSVVTQRSSPLTAVSGEARCVMTLKTAVLVGRRVA